MDDISKELDAIIRRLRGEHDVLPFMTHLHASSDMQMQRLPREMEAILQRSGDFQSPAPCVGPIWLKIETDDGNAELVVYRTSDRILYVAAPLNGL
jgi:hypothetical protein